MVQAQRAVSENEAKQNGDPQDRELQTKTDGQQPKQEDKKPSVIRRHPYWTALIIVGLIGLGIATYFVWLVYFYPYETTDDAFVDARSFALATKVSGYLKMSPLLTTPMSRLAP